MRILQISHRHHIRGGSDRVFFDTCDLLRRAGHEVIPFCIESPDNLPSPWSGYFPGAADTGRAPAADAIRYFFNREARSKLHHLIEDAGPFDVAHLHIYHGKQTPSVLSLLRKRGIPIVHSLHEYKLACPVYTLERNGQPCELCITGSALNCLRHRCKDGSALRSAVMLAESFTSRLLGDVRLIDRFICVSDFQRQIMRRAGIPSRKLLTMHNFLGPSELDAPPAGHDGYYLYFGRVEALKGLPTLLEAFVSDSRRLVIAGDGNWSGELQKRIAGRANIEFSGFKSGAPLKGLIAGARAVIVPSRWYENCPMSILEAKAQGRPVIGADIGGIPELVNHGIDGYLFEPGNPAALRDAIDALERADHATLSRAAFSDARSRFGARPYLAKLLKLYGELSHQRQPAAISAWPNPEPG